jgi:hypothetical protein
VRGYVIVEVDLDETVPTPFRDACEAVQAANIPGAVGLHIAAGDVGLREVVTRVTAP